MSTPLTAPISASTASFKVGDWLVEPSLNRMVCAGRAIKLDSRSMSVLVCLAQQHNQVVSLRELDARVWGDAIVAHSSIYQAIALLRRGFGDTRQVRRYIETIPRKGYRLVAPVCWQVAACSSNVSTQRPSERRLGERRRRPSELNAPRAGKLARRALRFALMIAVGGLGAWAARSLPAHSSWVSFWMTPSMAGTQGGARATAAGGAGPTRATADPPVQQWQITSGGAAGPLRGVMDHTAR